MVYIYIFWLIFGILAIIFSKGMIFAKIFGVIGVSAGFIGIISEIRYYIKLRNIKSESQQKEFTIREAEKISRRGVR